MAGIVRVADYNIQYIPVRRKKKAIRLGSNRHVVRAGNGSRTRDIDLGKVALYH